MLSTQDIESLYRSHSARLRRVVRVDARAPEEVVEDACQHAWSSVLAHRERVDASSAFWWLAATAVHEAWRLAEPREACPWPAEDAWSGEGWSATRCRTRAGDARAATPLVLAVPARTPPEIVELRDRLRQIRRLPMRQQRLLWLHAIGLSYAEMARHERMTLRTVERQLLRGKRAARSLGTQACAHGLGA